jgi:putative component of membrane protein insertase Oxa1/YidC/SpoIIIJ protein YidD
MIQNRRGKNETLCYITIVVQKYNRLVRPISPLSCRGAISSSGYELDTFKANKNLKVKQPRANIVRERLLPTEGAL